MNDKLKNSMKTIVRYIRDLSIVVAGIAVTLYVSEKVTNRGEKRDLNLYLKAIKMELDENMKIIDEAIDNLQPSLKYTEYLLANHIDSLNKDTVINNFDVGRILSAYSYSFKTNAFEMFKSSGCMRLADNKDLLLSLWDIYNCFIETKEMIDWDFKTRWEDIKKDVSMIEIGKNDDLEKAPLYNYHIIGIPYSMLKTYEEASKKTKEIVLLLEKELKMK